MRQIEFTYYGYKTLLETIHSYGFEFTDYHSYNKVKRPCILRHDVDMDIKKAAEFAAFENSLGFKSTYFILLSTDFYNLMSLGSQNCIKCILDAGHEIGLHYDEVKYSNESNTVENIKRESDILSQIIGKNVTTVSMHRPSKATLAADYKIPGLVNSYGKEFFQDFKYWSDSHMRWREDVYSLLQEEKYNKIHLLTHAFWYSNDKENNIKEILHNFIVKANIERYDSVNDNFTDLPELVKREDV